jgi:hypothetical protein
MSAFFRKKQKATDARELGAGPLEGQLQGPTQAKILKDTESPEPIASPSDSLMHAENDLGLNTVYEPSDSTRIITEY